MFESAMLGHKIDKETFKVEVPKLRAGLLEAQEKLRENGTFPVIILISGVDGAGKGDTINSLYAHLFRANAGRAAASVDVAFLAGSTEEGANRDCGGFVVFMASCRSDCRWSFAIRF